MQNSINQLIQNIQVISLEYDKINKQNGELFNVFSILNQRSSELSHSLFLSELLNTKGSHGQNDLFLKLFISEITNLFISIEKAETLVTFDTSFSEAITEKAIGRKMESSESSGRIDILIREKARNIIIENKIYATDQDKQLLRYYNYDKTAILIYLTLFKDQEPSHYSISDGIKTLIPNHDFINISYQVEIKQWIENCIKNTSDIPLIQVVLNQYLKLINELTNQSINTKMSEEIIKTILTSSESFKASELITQNFNNAKAKMWKEFGVVLVKNLSKKLPDIEINLDSKFGNKWSPLIFKNNRGSRCIVFSFMRDFNDVYIEIHPGWDNNIPITKDETVRLQLSEKIDCSELNISKFQIQKNLTNWQGEWVGKYDILKNSELKVFEKDQILIDEIVNDLMIIYNCYNQI